MSYDLLLLHPPYILNESDYPIFPLPWNLGHVGSTSYIGKYPVGPSWTYMPLGFNTMRNYIASHSDFSVGMENLAILRHTPPRSILKRFKSQEITDMSILTELAEAAHYQRTVAAIQGFEASIFAVDLHWIVYAQGALKTLELIKKHHPGSTTVIGGLTASYFADEIMDRYPFIDFLVWGDGCIPLLKLTEEINGDGNFGGIPNLYYRENDSIRKGPVRRLNDHTIVATDREPLDSVTMARGCPLNCITCGGSQSAFDQLFSQNESREYSVETILGKIESIGTYAPHINHVFLIHDPILTIGRKKWNTILDEIHRNSFNMTFLVEFFMPHTVEDIRIIGDKIPGSSIQISPESMDEEVRSFHKQLRYSNSDLIENLDAIRDHSDLSMGVWFLTGLAGDSRATVDTTISFVEEYYRKITDVHRDLLMYNEMLFLDPGSLAFMNPEQYGYKLRLKTLEDHVQGFSMPLFKYQMNYETRSLSRDDIVSLFLYMHDRMNEIYLRCGVLNEVQHGRISLYNNLLRRFESKYDEAMRVSSPADRIHRFIKLGMEFRAALNTVSDYPHKDISNITP